LGKGQRSRAGLGRAATRMSLKRDGVTMTDRGFAPFS
jgi:hypothetical protein